MENKIGWILFIVPMAICLVWILSKEAEKIGWSGVLALLWLPLGCGLAIWAIWFMKEKK